MSERVDLLLVEDDADNAFLLTSKLTEACGEDKFAMRVASTLAEAKSLLSAERFDLILLDLQLPDSDGLETVREAKAASRGTPIIVLTGMSETMVGPAALDQGAHDFISKDEADVRVLQRAIRYALARSRLGSQMERLVEASADAIVVLALDGSTRYANPAAKALLGSQGPAPKLPPSGRADLTIGERLAEVTVVDIEWRGEPAKLATMRDVTDLRRLAALRAEIKERRRMDQLKDRLLSGVSHEIRTPLTIITAAVANIRDELAGPLSPEQRKMSDIADKNLRRLARIVGNVLDLSRLESGRVKPARRRLSLSATAAEVVAGLRLAEAYPDRELACAVPERLPSIHADPDMLCQLLHNLLDNAMRHAAAKVALSASAQGNEVIVSVVDDGPGVPGERLGELFEAFVQLERPESGGGYKGTGLGLRICRELAHVNGGRVWAEPGPGGRFFLALPRYDHRLEQEARHESAHR